MPSRLKRRDHRFAFRVTVFDEATIAACDLLKVPEFFAFQPQTVCFGIKLAHASILSFVCEAYTSLVPRSTRMPSEKALSHYAGTGSARTSFSIGSSS